MVSNNVVWTIHIYVLHSISSWWWYTHSYLAFIENNGLRSIWLISETNSHLLCESSHKQCWSMSNQDIKKNVHLSIQHNMKLLVNKMLFFSPSFFTYVSWRPISDATTIYSFFVLFLLLLFLVLCHSHTETHTKKHSS